MLAFHPNSQTPVKKSKLHPLRQEQKANNRKLSRKRILIENIRLFGISHGTAHIWGHSD